MKEWAIRSLMAKTARRIGSILATYEVETVVLLQIRKASEMLQYVIS